MLFQKEQNMSKKNTNEIRIMRRAEVLKILGICKTTLYERIKEEKIPRQISLGDRSVGWISTEINAVLNAIIRADTED